MVCLLGHIHLYANGYLGSILRDDSARRAEEYGMEHRLFVYKGIWGKGADSPMLTRSTECPVRCIGSCGVSVYCLRVRSSLTGIMGGYKVGYRCKR